MITFLLSPYLSFTPGLRLTSSNNYSRPNLFAPLHRRFSGLFGVALLDFYFIVTFTALIHFISSAIRPIIVNIVSEN